MASYYTYGTNLRNKEFFTSTVNTDGKIKRYFSNIDSEIYFGNTKIDEMVEFQYTVDQKNLPIFSYNKYYADVIVPGQRIVQGTFIINFTDGKYMDKLMEDVPDSVYNELAFDFNVYSPGDDSKNKALFRKNFDITICYGDYKSDDPTYNATVQTICGAQIVNRGVAVSAKTGEPILEVFSFIAKDYKDDILDDYKVSKPSGDNSSSGGNNTTEDNNTDTSNKEEIKDNNTSTDNNNNSSNNNNNNNAQTNKDIEYYIMFQPSAGTDLHAIFVYTLTESKNIDVYTNGGTCTLEILDDYVYNYFKNEKTNYSKTFTLKWNKTFQRYDASFDESRPVVRNILAFHTNNPKKNVRVKIKYSVSINGKITTVEETNMTMRFNDPSHE